MLVSILILYIILVIRHCYVVFVVVYLRSLMSRNAMNGLSGILIRHYTKLLFYARMVVIQD